MTVFEALKSKNIDELAEWIDKYCMWDCSPWVQWWDENYCRKCDSVEHDGSEYGWCELNNKCKFFQDMSDTPDTKQTIKMWLESEI